ncbi:MAG TPA: hypothetical protein H9740_01840 [Candidatus Hungatella pullicola]|nr:hypothetical protein [Candidatus Hungatella pullicola]
MYNTLKKIIALAMTSLLLFNMGITSLANVKNNENLHLTFDLNEDNLNTPKTITRTLDNGITETITITPPAMTRSEVASEGSWTTEGHWNFMGVEVCRLTYMFDLVKSGNQWTIENARNLTYEGTFVNVRNKQLSIGRATSTPTLAANVSGQADVTILENQWITVGNATPTVTTNVFNGQVDIALSGMPN